MNRKDLTLIMDRGFFSEEKFGVLHSFGLKFLLPVKRNSLLYGRVVVEEYCVFVYHGSLIRFGKCVYGDYWLCRFKDESMATVEERVVFMKFSEGVYSMEQVEEKKRLFGQVLIVSNLDVGAEEVYLLYKRRDAVEKRFHTFKGVLDADVSYVRDNVSVFGHVFVSFLSMFIFAKLEDVIRRVGLLCRYSVEDVLVEYSKAYAVLTVDGFLDYEVPKKLELLDKKLGLNIFPILRS